MEPKRGGRALVQTEMVEFIAWFTVKAELLNAWLALTVSISVKQYQNQYVVKVLNAG